MDGVKPLRWIASAKDDLSAMPAEVRRAVGYALFAAQQGEKHDDAKVLKGFGDAAALEVIARHDGDAFRAVYTVRFGEVVYVLHVFKKKSKRGIATPKKELELIRSSPRRTTRNGARQEDRHEQGRNHYRGRGKRVRQSRHARRRSRARQGAADVPDRQAHQGARPDTDGRSGPAWYFAARCLAPDEASADGLLHRPITGAADRARHR